MDLTQLPSNGPAPDRFHRGGPRITAYRGEPVRHQQGTRGLGQIHHLVVAAIAFAVLVTLNGEATCATGEGIDVRPYCPISA